MPWPMVHFAIANKLADEQPSAPFLIGSIAPDAIHVRENCSRVDKGFTHLVKDNKLSSIETIMSHYLNYVNLDDTEDWKAFVRGYFSHIYTDLRWTETVYADFERQCQGRPSDEIRRIYNVEVSQIEFVLLRSGEWANRAISLLMGANGYAIQPFVAQDEVAKYRDEKIEWLLNDLTLIRYTLRQIRLKNSLLGRRMN